MTTLCRVIFLVVIVSYGTNAASRSDYQDYLTRNDDEEGSIQYPDEDESADISSLQDEVYQETDVFDLRKKKAQTLCKVVKIQKQHHEEGYEFHPKSYNEYECVPYNDSRDHHNFDVCSVHNAKCVSVEKYHYYMKSKNGANCWSLQRKIVKAGCKCIPSLPSK